MTSTKDYIGSFHIQWATKQGFSSQSMTRKSFSEAQTYYEKLVGDRTANRDILMAAIFEYSNQLQEWKLLDIWSYDAKDFN